MLQRRPHPEMHQVPTLENHSCVRLGWGWFIEQEGLNLETNDGSADTANFAVGLNLTMEAGRGDSLSSAIKQYIQALLKVALYPSLCRNS